MRKAFTLIELLVVVAIIAILAAIMVPNLLEAMTRTKVSRAKSDMRTIALGLETYLIDNNRYPSCNNNMMPARRPKKDGTIPVDEKAVLERLSTPIAYLTTSFIEDPFRPKVRSAEHTAANPQGEDVRSIYESNVGIAPTYNPHWLIKYGAIHPSPTQETGFANEGHEPPRGWVLYSGGPDGNYAALGTMMKLSQPTVVPMSQFYDPTNGTTSYGDIYRVNRGALSYYGFAGRFMWMAERQK